MYGNHTKSQWRNRVWDALDQKGADKNGWVLALAGTAFKDRKAALRHGFNRHQIIGVDTDSDVVKHNTSHGRTVIQGDLPKVMSVWDDSRPTSVVIADFCCNASAAAVHHTLWTWMNLKAFQNCWLLLNVAMGREKGDFLAWLQLTQEAGFNHVLDGSEVPPDMKNIHRGMAVVRFFLEEQYPNVPPGHLHALQRNITTLVTTYQAHKVNMQGVLLAPRFDEEWDAGRLSSPEYFKVIHEHLNESAIYSKLRRHIGAKLAWSTMRRTGNLGGRKK